MQNGVTFWTEGGPSIGMGHVMRCINIAHALQERAQPLFLVNNERPVIERLDQEAFFHITYPMTGRHASRLANGVVVIDTKRDVSGQVKVLKEEGRKVVLIDNTSSADADAVVVPSPIYSGSASVNLRSGKEYLIIGDNFKAARPSVKTAHDLPLKVLITMGGSDPFNLTELVMKALMPVEGIEATVVIGPAFRILPSLEDLIETSGWKYRFLFNVKDMAEVMKGCHLAFTAVGTTVYELAYMGVPSMLVGNYESDKADLAALDSMGVARNLGYYREASQEAIAAAVEELKRDPVRWESMAGRAMALTDGRGAARIAELILSLLDE